MCDRSIYLYKFIINLRASIKFKYINFSSTLVQIFSFPKFGIEAAWNMWKAFSFESALYIFLATGSLYSIRTITNIPVWIHPCSWLRGRPISFPILKVQFCVCHRETWLNSKFSSKGNCFISVGSHTHSNRFTFFLVGISLWERRVLLIIEYAKPPLASI